MSRVVVRAAIPGSMHAAAENRRFEALESPSLVKRFILFLSTPHRGLLPKLRTAKNIHAH
jgi:hypothetical protein